MSHRKILLDLLLKHAVQFGDFTLSSGKKSNFFIDCKQVILTSEGHQLAGELLFEQLYHKTDDIEAVAGVALGGCALASAVSMGCEEWGYRNELPALYVRKEAKDHGTKKLVEGRAPNGALVALLEDVVTTGASSLTAVRALEEAGYKVPLVVALVDREEGGAEAIRSASIEFRSVFKRSDFQSGAQERA